MNPSFDGDRDGWSFSHEAQLSSAWSAGDDACCRSMRVHGSVTNGDVSAWSTYVPVAAGETYSGRITGRLNSSITGMRVRVEWAGDGDRIGYVTGAAATGGVGDVRTASVTGVAPSGATRARLRVYDDGTGTWDANLDAAMLVKGGVPGSYKSSLPDNLLAAVNPSFGWELDGWTFTHSAAYTSDWSYDATNDKSARLTGTVSGTNDVSAWSSLVPVDAAKTYSARMTARFLAGSSIDRFKLRIEWYDASGQIADVTSDAAGGVDATASLTAVAPAGATRARLRAYGVGTGASSSTLDAYLDSAMLVEGGIPTSYYDTPPPPNLLAAMNPSFEWELDGWTFTHSGSWATDSGYDESNNKSLRLVGSVSGANDVSAWSGFAPVDAGKRYGARITARFNAASSINSVKLRIEWFDASGQIATTTGSAAIGNPQGTASVSADAPAGATRARLRVFGVGTGTGTSTLDANLDSAMLVEGAVPSKYHQTPLPANLLAAMNPSFGWDLDGWSFTHSASPTEAWHYDDANYKAVHVTGSVAGANDVSAHSSLVAVTAGRVYSARMTARFLSGSSINSFKLRIEWFERVRELRGLHGRASRGHGGDRVRDGDRSGRCDVARLRVYGEGTGSGTSTLDAYLDGAMVVEGGVPSKAYHYDPPLNLLSRFNPSFESGLGHWSLTHTSQSVSDWSYAGTKSAYLTGAVTNNDVNAYSAFVSVTPGRAYSSRVTAKIQQALQGMRVRIEWWHDSGQISDTTGPHVGGTPGQLARRPSPALLRRARRAHDCGSSTPAPAPGKRESTRRCSSRAGSRPSTTWRAKATRRA